MRLEAEKAGVVTQMGNQIQSAIEYRSAVVLLQEGVIGKVKEVHAWSGAQFPQRGRPEGADPVPATLDWDKWLGVAPARPFKNGIYHPFNWRGWIDFGGGAIGDFGCHILDTPFKALDLTAPTSIKAPGARRLGRQPRRGIPKTGPTGRSSTTSSPAPNTPPVPRSRSPGTTASKQPPRELFPFENENRDHPRRRQPLHRRGRRPPPPTRRRPRSSSPTAGTRASSAPISSPQPLPQLRRRLPRQGQDHLPLRLRRPAHRSRPPRQRRQPLPRQGTRLELRRPRRSPTSTPPTASSAANTARAGASTGSAESVIFGAPSPSSLIGAGICLALSPFS